jgi:L,D-transpeptidase YcbB
MMLRLPHPWRICALPLLLVITGGCSSKGSSNTTYAPAAGQVSSVPVDTGAIAARIKANAASGQLAELRWPNFTDYRGHVQKFYDSSNYSAGWVSGSQPTQQALDVIKAFQAAAGKGLDPEDYDGSKWASRITQLSAGAGADQIADFDLALTVCAMRFVSDEHIGKVNPQHFDFGIDVVEKKYDLPLFLSEKLIHATDVNSALDSAEPPFRPYARTKQVLQQYLAFARNAPAAPLPAVDKPPTIGQTYAAASQLSALLRMLGDLPAQATVDTNSSVFDQQLSDALKHFQRRHGLTQTGTLNKDTLAQLNIPMSVRVRQLQDALERYRWLSPEFAQPPIVVNIPEFKLRAFAPDRSVGLRMNVVVGKSYRHQTPIFTDNMKYLVFRPYWNVPPSIQRSEIVPGIQKDRNYLAKKGFEVTNSKGDIITAGTVSDEVLQGLRNGSLMVRQRPGPKNSLGLAKFIFPNSHNVYLHGTPAQSLFSQSRRDFSHGCIRVESPADLAAWILKGRPEWSIDRIRDAMNTGKDDQQINLAQPIPVLILYVTAIVEEDGEVLFFNDIYGLDRSLDEVLAKGYPYPG